MYEQGEKGVKNPNFSRSFFENDPNCNKIKKDFTVLTYFSIRLDCVKSNDSHSQNFSRLFYESGYITRLTLFIHIS